MELLPITIFLNRIFGGVANALLDALHIQHSARAPITNAVAVQLLVFAILFLTFVYLRMRVSVDNPGGVQHFFEAVNGFVNDQSKEIIGGHHYKEFAPYLVTLGLYILTCNLIGLVPSLEAPTANATVPLGCALVTWFYYHFHGLRANGLIGYIKHFMGPVWWLAPLLLPIELFSHAARLLSLTVRLYANMFAGDMVTMVFFSLAPVAIPVIFMGLHIGVAFIQTYIFVLLATVYLGEAVAHEH